MRIDERLAGTREASPLERAERCHAELVAHYGGGERAEERAAAKLLIVALVQLRAHGGADWAALVDEYVGIAKHDPGKLARIVAGNRGTRAM